MTHILLPPKSESAIFVGQNGSGKSYAAKTLLTDTAYKDIIIIDPKAEIGIRDAKYVHKPSDLTKVKSGVVIYQPDSEYENKDSYNEVFRHVYYKGNVLLFIDELLAVGSDDWHTYPSMLRSVYTRGRSLGISIWACTQRPSGIPLYALSESKHFFCFKLLIDEDRVRMSKFMGKDVMNIPKGHNFYHMNTGSDDKVRLTTI